MNTKSWKCESCGAAVSEALSSCDACADGASTEGASPVPPVSGESELSDWAVRPSAEKRAETGGVIVAVIIVGLLGTMFVQVTDGGSARDRARAAEAALERASGGLGSSTLQVTKSKPNRTAVLNPATLSSDHYRDLVPGLLGTCRSSDNCKMLCPNNERAQTSRAANGAWWAYCTVYDAQQKRWLPSGRGPRVSFFEDGSYQVDARLDHFGVMASHNFRPNGKKWMIDVEWNEGERVAACWDEAGKYQYCDPIY